MEITVYDRNLKRQGVIDNYSSLQWMRKYYEPGMFELHVPATDKNIKLLQAGNIITIGAKKEAAIISSISNEESIQVNELVRTGSFLPIYLKKRLTGPIFNFTGKNVEAIYQLLQRATPIPGLKLAEMIKNESSVSFQVTYKNLLSYIEKLATAAGIGFRIVPNFKTKEMSFELFEGVDRTAKQNQNARITFSNEYNNLNQVKYSYNDELYASKAIVEGVKDEKKFYREVGLASGLDLCEIYVDATDIEQGTMTEEEFISALDTRGREALLSNTIIESFETSVEPSVNFKYMTDYDLGDIVTVKKKSWNKEKDLRITEITEVYENGGMYVALVFGNSIPDKVSWTEN